MKTKTCGECEWFVLNHKGRCYNREEEEYADSSCCPLFEPKVITNGDKIRQMSDEELAEKFVYYIEGEHSPFDRRWKSTLIGDVCYADRSLAIKATIKELKKEYKEQ